MRQERIKMNERKKIICNEFCLTIFFLLFLLFTLYFRQYAVLAIIIIFVIVVMILVCLSTFNNFFFFASLRFYFFRFKDLFRKNLILMFYLFLINSHIEFFFHTNRFFLLMLII